MMRESTPRIHFVTIILISFALILIGRLFFIQIVQGSSYKKRADKQYVVPTTDSFNRGTIFLSERNNKLIGAASLKSGYTIIINPKKIDNPDIVYSKISKIIDIQKDVFYEKAGKKNDFYEEIADKVSKDNADRIIDLALSGVSVKKTKWRFYPGGRTASHVLGLVAYRGDDLLGRYGLEHYYEDVLARNSEDLYVNFFAEIFSNIAESVVKTKSVKEGDIVTTIEPYVQTQLEKTLSEIKEKWSTSSVGGIIIDPRDGAVYAMASKPDFNPNDFSSEKSVSVFSNPLVENVYEMGSIVKPLVMAAAIDMDAVTANTTYEDMGYVNVDGAHIENYDGKARGKVSMQEVLNQSLNTGMVFVMRKMGKESFRDYMLAYGIGEETGIDLPGEVPGMVGNLSSSRDVEYATASFGQGIAMTPIGIARSLASLANGGILKTPYIVKKIMYKGGLDKKTYPDEGKRVLKKESSDEITRMLVEVVDTSLSNGSVALPHYSIAAKTGTAQIADTENGGYYKDRYLHSFFGYFPAYNPQFLIFLYNLDPKGARYASQTLTYPFMDLVKFLINYYEIEPDR